MFIHLCEEMCVWHFSQSKLLLLFLLIFWIPPVCMCVAHVHVITCSCSAVILVFVSQRSESLIFLHELLLEALPPESSVCSLEVICQITHSHSHPVTGYHVLVKHARVGNSHIWLKSRCNLIIITGNVRVGFSKF